MKTRRAVAALLLMAALETALSNTPNGKNNSAENESPSREYNGGGSYLGGKSGVGKLKSTLPNRDFSRKNYENRSDFERRFQGKEKSVDEEVFPRGKGETFARKPPLPKEENFDSYNMKVLNNRDKQEEKVLPGNAFRSDDSYAPNRHPTLEGTDDYLSTNRQKKMKKHGSGFIPFPAPRERKPNIILILTDDQDVELGSLNFMPKTLRLLRDGGAEFRHAYVTTPMCCPSRSSLLTGMYVHNHNVFTNNENCSNIQWQQTHETRTFATYLSNAGYRTGYFGKYLNKYNGSYIPPGWREWGGLIMNSRYYNYSINLNGKKIKHGFDYHKDYYPDLIANDSIAFLRQSKQYFSRKPVMLVVSFPAPHGPEDSAPQYSKMFFNITTHHTPAYDFAPNPDKQWILQVTNKMQDIHKQFTDVLMTKRLQTLQSVDSAVERIYQELKNIGELDNTYIIYTSDHGYHLGQFGLVKGKSFPFEFDVRVPFLVRGPGIEAGTVVDDIVLNIDLAPTFLDIAGVESPPHMDGRSIVRLLHHRPTKRRRLRWPDTFLIESSGRREIPDSNPEVKRLRQEKLKVKEARLLKGKGVATKGFEGVTQNSEHFVGKKTNSGNADSSETEADEIEEEENSEEENASVSFAHELRRISESADVQVDNKIPQIVPPISHPIPKLARLALECQNPDLQTPCQPGQKWHCMPDGERWRKYKCKFQKKCTCFTPTGFVYTRLYNEDRMAVFGKSKFGSRKKRSSDVWNLIPETMDQEILLSLLSRSSKVMSRRKREATEEHLTDVFDDLEQELIEAEETEISINATFTLGQEPNITRCSVTSLGKVNCSNLIYSDLKIWKRTRDEIEAKIKSLRAELEALKEIRKHLREKRPESATTEVTGTTVSSTLGETEEYINETYSENYMTGTSPKVQEPENEVEFSTRKYFSEPSADTTPTAEESHFTYSTVGIEEVSTTKRPKEDLSFRQKNHSRFRTNEDGSSNRIYGVTTVSRGRDRCLCRPDNMDAISKKEEKEFAKEARRKLKEERLRKKERKLKKKAKIEKECVSEKMNCFIHDNEHWRTPPLWTEGPFCFCMNANNNTYSCLRTINATHNFLYCEFTTGFKTFYNLRIDPFEQLNRISTLTPDESRFLSNQLADMKGCRGTKDCTTGSGRENVGYHHQHQHQHPHYAYHSRLKSELTY